MFCSRLPVGEGNIKALPFIGGCRLMMLAKRTGTGTFRSSQRFGKKPRSGLEVTRIVRNARVTSPQNRYITCCEPNPGNRKVEKRARSHSSQAVKNLASSSCVYS